MILSARPASTHGGAFGQSPQTLEGDAMDEKISPGVRYLFGRAKTRGPDPPTLGSSLPINHRQATEAIKPGTPGRARQYARKPSRGERRIVSAYLW